MTLKCPVCAGPLLQIPLHDRVSHICTRKHGRALSTSAVRKWLMPEAQPILDEALTKSKAPGCLCPRCWKKMRLLKFGQALEIDHCDNCSLIWFDQGEHESMPQRDAKDIEDDAKSKFDIEVEMKLSFREGMSPYENIKGDQSKFPVITILLILACTAVTYLAKANGFRGFVFDAGRPFAGFGIPAMLSTFAHANGAHLVGNIFFFFFPGALLESTCGEKALLRLFFFCAFASLVVEAIFLPNSRSLGASGAISGIFTALWLTQPKAVHVSQDRGFLLQALGFYTITYRVPIWAMYGFWLFSQAMGGWDQMAGNGKGIGYIAHLAGALAGAFYVFSSDMKVLSPARTSGG